MERIVDDPHDKVVLTVHNRESGDLVQRSVRSRAVAMVQADYINSHHVATAEVVELDDAALAYSPEFVEDRRHAEQEIAAGDIGQPAAEVFAELDRE